MHPEANGVAPTLISEASLSTRPQPPIAHRRPVEHVFHDDRGMDHYAWLREKDNPEVMAYLKSENAYTDAILANTTALQEKLYQEMLARILQTDLSVPYRLRGYLYFTRTEENQQYAFHYRKRDLKDSVEELLLDLNALAEGHFYLALGVFAVTDDNHLLAYSLDTTGLRQYTLRIKNLRTGEILPEQIKRVTSAAWAADNRTLFYTVEDEATKRSYRLYRHVSGGTEPDSLLYEEHDERFRVEIERTRSGAHLLLTSTSHTTSDVRYLLADQPAAGFRVIAPREDNHEYYVDHHASPTSEQSGGIFYIRTNSGGRTFRLVTAPVTDHTQDSWREFIPNRPDVMLASVLAFRSHLVLVEREGGLPYLRIVPLGASVDESLASSQRIKFREPVYNAYLGPNPEFTTDYLRYHYESFITPRSVFDYNLRTGDSILRKQQPVLGAYDPAAYISERLYAAAHDGTRIPVSIVHRRDLPRGTAGPLLLYGYGSYGIAAPVIFSSNRLSLLDRGVIYAIAHVRGGGELGKPWHDAGRMHKKLNTFTDFIAAAEHLIALGYTSPDRLAIEGGSAGGLLMGAVVNLRPELFDVVVSHVPFVDVLNTMLDASLPLTIGEYEEWGNPQLADDYFYIKSYCPYSNIERKAYPAMLVKTSRNDSQVMYWEPAKYVAKLRALKTDSNPVLLKINMDAGHSGASGRYDYLRETALDYAFVLTQLGVCS